MKLKHQLPTFYQKILPQEFLQFEIEEKKATCENCIMSRPQNKAEIHYQADLKCCTFHPFLPNFLVGAILEDPSLKLGAEVIRKKIQTREYALPIGMVAPVRYQLEFQKRKKNDFGQKANWLCPYYNKQNNNCNVWKYRGVVCSTFFCKSSYGKKGLHFWDTTSDYLSYVEMALMEEALVYLDFSPRQTNELISFLNRDQGTTAEKKSWILPQEKFNNLWNGYHEDIEVFYRRSFEIVRNLNRTGFKELIGETGKTLEQRVLNCMPQIES